MVREFTDKHRKKLSKAAKGTNNLTTGRSSRAILGVAGCKNCPWRRTCTVYNPDSLIGCDARMNHLLRIRKEIGNVESNLFNRAVSLREEVESEATKIRSSGESPIQNKAWREAWKLDLELAKFMTRMKHGTKQTIRVERVEEDNIIINPAMSGDQKEEKKEKDD